MTLNPDRFRGRTHLDGAEGSLVVGALPRESRVARGSHAHDEYPDVLLRSLHAPPGLSKTTY